MVLEALPVLERVWTWANGIEPLSNQQSSTSVTRRFIDCPVGSSGLGRTHSSTAGRWRSDHLLAQVALQIRQADVDVHRR